MVGLDPRWVRMMVVSGITTTGCESELRQAGQAEPQDATPARAVGPPCGWGSPEELELAGGTACAIPLRTPSGCAHLIWPHLGG